MLSTKLIKRLHILSTEFCLLSRNCLESFTIIETTWVLLLTLTFYDLEESTTTTTTITTITTTITTTTTTRPTTSATD